MATVKKEGERINQFITAPEVRVVHDERGSLGVMSIKDALALAKSEGSDLVEIAPTAEPPVCKIINYGKYKFDIQKKSKEANINSIEKYIKKVLEFNQNEEINRDIILKLINKIVIENKKIKSISYNFSIPKN